jgi:putative nucleotidyltransferase with HDIG domain
MVDKTMIDRISELQKKQIMDFAKKRASENDQFHNIQHLEETAAHAVRLAKAEGANQSICWVAGILHDICKSKEGDHAVNGATEAKEFLTEIGVGKKFTESVSDAIYHHNKDFTDGPIERKILWDADKLPMMHVEGFKKRLLPFWVLRLGKEDGTKKAIEEYYFYKARFHTNTARKEVLEDKEVESFISIISKLR